MLPHFFDVGDKAGEWRSVGRVELMVWGVLFCKGCPALVVIFLLISAFPEFFEVVFTFFEKILLKE